MPPQQRSRQGRVQVSSDLGHDLLGVADPRRPAAFAAGPKLPLPPLSLLSLPWFLGFFWRGLGEVVGLAQQVLCLLSAEAGP
jgi:hypothetical protein